MKRFGGIRNLLCTHVQTSFGWRAQSTRRPRPLPSTSSASNELNITSTHTHERITLGLLPDWFVCRHWSARSISLAPPAAGQLSLQQLIKMPAEFTSSLPGCKFSLSSVACQEDTQPFHAQRGSMTSNASRLIMIIKWYYRWLPHRLSLCCCQVANVEMFYFNE